MNQRDFAARLGTGSGRVSQIEQNKNVPGGEFLLRLHQEFGVDITWVLAGANVDSAVPATQTNPREAALLDNYRAAGEDAKKALETTSAAFAKRDLSKKGHAA